MESRIRSIFLSGLLLPISLVFALTAHAQSSDEPPQVIEPEVERRDIDVRKIDTEDWELTGFLGMMSVG